MIVVSPYRAKLIKHSSGIDNGTLVFGDRSSFVVDDRTAAFFVAGISGCLIPYMG